MSEEIKLSLRRKQSITNEFLLHNDVSLLWGERR